MPVKQLSLDVRQHPNAEQRGDGFLTASLKLQGALPLGRDLNPGDDLMVTVSSADGEIIATGTFETGPVGFAPISDKTAGVVGLERVHKAKLDPETAAIVEPS